ncbi:MAG: ABC transporter substrate-binding protein [Candidatus Eremiobacteraeota bacterium]|nr:ABC transporter substrate-binding protein [Candidatus Eremiobacteraeota bacterium]MCW5865836.1 ABC transporter substrate-binding protein [Candidatus Eremiobacteraeota bacterium]
MRIGLLALSLLLWGCTPRTPVSEPFGTVPSAPPEDVLVVGKPDDASGLDPALISDGESSQVCRNLFDTLVRHSANSMKLEPALAVSWKHSPDGLIWTFNLRKGVKFHDGTPFNAQAVVDNYSRQLQPTHPLRFPGNRFPYWADIWGTNPCLIDSLEAQDDYTVNFHMSEVVAPFVENMAMPFFGIVSPTALKKYGSDGFKHPVGTGAYRFVEWLPRERIVLEANPDYWDGPPAMKKVVFLPIKDATSRQLQLEAGKVHLITGVSLEKVEKLSLNRAVSVLSQPGMNVGYLAMNNEDPHFRQPLVRQAICQAIERQEIARALYRGLAVVAESHLPPMIWGQADLRAYEYNPDKARQLLARAGYPNGFKTEIWYMSAARTYYPDPKIMGEVLQAMLGEVGIEVDLKAVDWGSYLERVGKGEHQMALGGWVGDTGDPDNYLYVMLDDNNVNRRRGGSNLCLFKDAEVHKRLLKARQMVIQEDRARLYAEAQVLVHEKCPSLPLVHAPQVGATHPQLEGYKLHPTGTMILQYVRWKRP